MKTYEQGTEVRTDTTFEDEDGNLTDPTTVTLVVRSPDNVLTTIPNVHDGLGLYHGLIPTDQPGWWWLRWVGEGALVAVTEEDFYIVPSRTLDPGLPAVGQGPVLGPCQVWIGANDVAACIGAEAAATADIALLETAAVEASMTLYEMSGRRFSGVCEEQVRPCSPYNTCWLGMVGGNPGWHWGSTYAGAWAWTMGDDYSTQQLCGCQPIPEVLLTYPVDEVSEVLIGGVALDPSAYRVDEYQRLVRVDGAWWPTCQNLLLPATEEGTFAVTYTHGVAPPPLGQSAAAQLAGELYRACTGAECKLPTGTTKINRQGVTIERGLLASWFLRTRFGSGWNTGLSLVDVFLATYNPGALRRAPGVWSPDLTKQPRRVGT